MEPVLPADAGPESNEDGTEFKKLPERTSMTQVTPLDSTEPEKAAIIVREDPEVG